MGAMIIVNLVGGFMRRKNDLKITQKMIHEGKWFTIEHSIIYLGHVPFT